MTFDRIAFLYDRLAHLAFGRALERAQLLLLDHVPARGNWLIVGGGTGWILETVLNRCHPDHVLYLEASNQMLHRARQRIQGQSAQATVTFLHGTEADLPPGEEFSVILTPFVLDLFTEELLATHILPRLQQVIRPGGYWLATDFVRTSVWWHRTLVAAMLVFFRVTAGLQTRRLPDWSALLGQRMQRLAHEEALGGLVRSELFTPFPEKGPQ